MTAPLAKVIMAINTVRSSDPIEAATKRHARVFAVYIGVLTYGDPESCSFAAQIKNVLVASGKDTPWQSRRIILGYPKWGQKHTY